MQDSDREKKKLDELKMEQQKKFRNLQDDRKIFVEQSLATFKGQKATIDKLKKVNEALKDTINKISNQHKMLGLGDQAVQNVIEILKQKINEEKTLQSRKDDHIRDFQEKILQKKTDLGGHNAGAENESTLQKQIKILQNRLDKANQKFNEAISVNKQLRQVIDSLRRQRKIFDNLYKKLQKELYAKRKEMADIIERANTAYQQRDRSNFQINNLKQQSKKQTTDFQRELKDLSQRLQITKVRQFMQSKQKPHRQQLHKNQPSESKSAKNFKISKQKNTGHTPEQPKNYEEDLAKIQAATNMNNFQDLMRIFEENEQKNFEMFNYVNMQSNQIEQLEKQINELQQEIRIYEGQPNTSQDDKQKYLNKLQEKCSVSQDNVKKFQSRYNQNFKQLKNLTGWIQNLFNTAECDKAAAKQIAGSTNISDSNMMIFLGIIQERVVKIINAYKDITSKQAQIKDIITKAEKMPEKNKKAIEMPPFDEMNDQEVDGDKILTLDDFKKKANDTIKRDQEKLLKKDQKSKKK